MFKKIIAKIFYRKHTVKLELYDKTFIAFYRRLDKYKFCKNAIYIEYAPKILKKLTLKDFFIWDVDFFALDKDGILDYIRSEYLGKSIFPRTKIKKNLINQAHTYIQIPQILLKSFNFEQGTIKTNKENQYD